MAYVSSTRTGIGWEGSGEGAFSDRRVVPYQVIVDDMNDGPEVVLAGATAATATPHRVAEWGQSYSVGNDSNANLVAKSYSVTPSGQQGSRSYAWDLKVTYETRKRREGDDDTGDFQADPRLRPTKWTLETFSRSRTLDEARKKDRNTGIIGGAPERVENIVGDEFVPPVEVDDEIPVLVAKRNVGSFATVLAHAVGFRRKINSDEFFAQANGTQFSVLARHAQFLPMRVGELTIENGFGFWPCVYRFAVYDDEVRHVLVEQGVRVKNAAGELVVPKDPTNDGIVLPPPYRLDTDGTLLADEAEAITTEWYEPEIDFNTLGL